MLKILKRSYNILNLKKRNFSCDYRNNKPIFSLILSPLISGLFFRF